MEDSLNEQMTPPATEQGFVVTGIGASAGGIQALKKFFGQVPERSGIAYVVILHLSPDHDSKLAEVIRISAKIPVVQVTEKLQIRPDTVYVVSPNRHLSMSDGHIVVSANLTTEDRRAPVDIFFRTLAESHGSLAVCVVLSGTGANGSMGMKRIKEMGGAAFVQSPLDAEFSEMPRNSIATNLVDDVLPAADIPGKIISYRDNLHKAHIDAGLWKKPEDQQSALAEIFDQLRKVTGHDFSNYKKATLLRRIERRVSVRNLPDLFSYAEYIKNNIEETNALMKDLLISVTNFFRDHKAFKALEDQIIPDILRNKKEGADLRIWVAGCATGEEAYSIAMICADQAVRTKGTKTLVFATDIDDEAIATAREGFYSPNDAADISQERLNRYFNKEANGYRVKNEVREMILFANHNFLKDPPFSHVALVSCRNVLIYLNRSAQERVMETFHFALDNGGYLFLGTSESVDDSASLFEPVSRAHHIFKTRPTALRSYPVPESVSRGRTGVPQGGSDLEKKANPEGRTTYGDLHQHMLEQYAPPSLVINEEYDIVHLSEKVTAYLRFPGGEPSQNIFRMVHPDLRIELRSALYHAVQQKKAVVVKGIALGSEHGTEVINVHIRPAVKDLDIAKGYILVIFEKVKDQAEGSSVVPRSDGAVAKHLEEELLRHKALLHDANEHHEFQAEELKASNEELQAMNEEMRSSAEELETSREELQSMNEELRTVNQELKVKIEETTLTSNNLRNLINSASIATVFLDRSLHIAMFTPAALDIFNLISSDNGRPLSDITHKLEYDSLLRDSEKVIERLVPIEREVRATDDRIYIMRILPYWTAEDQINGAVITFIDITQRKNSEEAMHKSEMQLKHFVTATSDAIYTMSGDWSEMRSLKGRQFIKDTDRPTKNWLDRYIPSGEQANLQRAIEKAVSGKNIFELEHKIIKADGSTGWASSRAVPMLGDDGKITGWFGAASDITDRKNSEEALKRSEERFRLMSDSGLLGIAFFDGIGRITNANDAFLRMVGYDQAQFDEAVLDWVALTAPEQQQRTEEALGEFRRKGFIQPFENRYLRRDGSRIWGLMGSAKFAGRDEGLSFMLDISALKSLEEQKESFLSIASHELKTPVTSIKVYGELLEEMLKAGSDGFDPVLVKKLNGQIDRLSGLISDLLDTSKISEGGLSLSISSFDINDLVKEQAGDLQLLYATHRLLLNLSDLKAVRADRERIGQVLTNLVSNAVKYSPGGMDIHISTSAALNGVKVSVRDHGIGIPPALKKNIFEKFFRAADPSIDTYPGMGLGLYISAGIIARHGGTIGVASNEGKGSEFHFTIPYEIPQPS